MKKFITTGILCALFFSATGCGEKAADTMGLVKEPLTENVETYQGGDQTVQGNAETTSADNTAVSAGSDIYEAFKNGTAKAKYRGTGDMTSYLETAAALEVGQSYTVEEIAEALKTVGEYKDVITSVSVDYSNIDCGQDGVPELLAEAHMGDEFRLFLIIKEIDGELVICFDQDAWSRSDTVVNTDGTIETGGSGGAALHYMDYSFVDANGDYKYYYGVEETSSLYGGYYAYKKGEDFVEIATDDLDWEHTGVRDYYFEPDYQMRDNYYTYFIMDDQYMDITTNDDYDDSNVLKQRFTEAGIQIYTMAEINDMLVSRGKEIGWPR